MLLSTVFILRPRAAGTLPLTQGHAIHAWFLHLVQQHEPALAAWLHRQERRKPFTTSPLQGMFTRQGPSAIVDPAHTYWLRVTSLHADLSALLLALAAAPPALVRLFQVEFELLTVATQPQEHAWAGQSSYAHLYNRATAEPPAAQATVEFASPTVFRSQGRHLVLPLPRLLFSSLWEGWHAFAPLALPPGLLPLLSTELDILRYTLHTQMGDFGNYRQVGFVGSCTFGLPRRRAVEVLRGMQLLLEAAFFTGVGYKTTMGMGQVRSLPQGHQDTPAARALAIAP